MAKLEKVGTVLEYPERYGGLSQVKIEIPLEFREVTLKNDMTGTKSHQTFGTEMNHTWVPFRFKGKLYLASRELSNKHLHLSGKSGYMSDGSCQREIAKLYVNEKMGIKGIPFTKEMFESLPTFLKEKLDHCWTADSASRLNELGYWAVLGGKLEKVGLMNTDWEGNKQKTYGFNFNMLLVVEIPENAFISVNVTKGKASKLYTTEPYIVTDEQMQELTLLARESGQKGILRILAEIAEDR